MADTNRAAPAARRNPNPQATPAQMVGGNPTPNPTELGNIDYLDSEGRLRRNLHGTAPLFGEVLPHGEDESAGVAKIKEIGDFDDPKFPQTAELNKRANNEHKLEFLKNASARLSSYIRDRVIHPLREGNKDVEQMIHSALESASTSGFPALRGEASILLNSRNRVGTNKVTKNTGTNFLFGCPRLLSGATVNPMWIGEGEWLVADFGDNIPLIKNDPISSIRVRSYPGRINV